MIDHVIESYWHVILEWEMQTGVISGDSLLKQTCGRCHALSLRSEPAALKVQFDLVEDCLLLEELKCSLWHSFFGLVPEGPLVQIVQGGLG